MLRRFALFTLIVGVFGAIWWWKPWEKNEPEPDFFDRLPSAEIIGKVDILNLAEQLQPLFYFYKIPRRDFVSKEFFLRQAKTYGLDIQKPVYFFGELDSTQQEFGILTHLTDSSKVRQGIEYINIFLETKPEKIEEHPLIIIPKIDLAFAYGNNWMLISRPKEIKEHLTAILSTKKGGIKKEWAQFLQKDSLSQSVFSSRINTKKINELGIEKMNVQLKNDSSHLEIYTEVVAQNDFPFQLKPIKNGLQQETFTRALANFNFSNLDVNKLKTQGYYTWLEKQTHRFGFPLEEFLAVWTGQLSFRHGGWHIISEKYVESEYDENFNYVEVAKYRSKKVKGTSCFISVNNQFESLKTSLLARGILTHQERKNYFLFSPPLNEKKSDSTALYYTNRYLPTLTDSLTQGGMLTLDGVPYTVLLDSLEGNRLFGKLRFPVGKWVE